MDETSRFWSELVGRLTGPLTFRLILQPVMAAINAARDGVKDSRQGRPPYFWTMFTKPSEREHLLKEGWTAELRVIVLGVVMDLVYQYIVFKGIRPLELIVVVFVLAFILDGNSRQNLATFCTT
jgi:hypothetical protein